MADKNIDQIFTDSPASTPLSGTERIYMVQGGVDAVATAQDIADLGGSSAAVDVSFDNTGTGLSAVDVQAAIVEVLESIPGAVVDNAPTIAQTLWWESHQFGSADTGFNTQQSGYSIISADSGSRILRCITGAGTTSNVYQRRGATPTWDMQLGSFYNDRSRGAFVINKPLPAAIAHIACGAMPANTNATPPTTIIGLTKDLSDVWQIKIRFADTDLATPVTISVTEGQALLVCVAVTGNGTDRITDARVGVFDYITGNLIDSLTWTGSENITGMNFEAWTSRPDGSTGSPGAQETLRIFYQAYGPVPSPTLNPFFAQL